MTFESVRIPTRRFVCVLIYGTCCAGLSAVRSATRLAAAAPSAPTSAASPRLFFPPAAAGAAPAARRRRGIRPSPPPGRSASSARRSVSDGAEPSSEAPPPAAAAAAAAAASDPPEPRKSHCAAVCMVPPPSAAAAWDALTRARRELRDPGFYRWPPHANLLYPFVALKSMKGRTGGEVDDELFDGEMLDALERAAGRCEAFEVTLDRMGTFGGRSRGVLWAYPRSHRNADAEGGDGFPPRVDAEGGDMCDPSEPTIQLQALLEEQFPTCTEQRKQRRFHPHITLSHFESLEDAQEAQSKVEQWWTRITFTVSEIYVLRRVGDGGQFEIAATVPLGSRDAARVGIRDDEAEPRQRLIRVHDPPVVFPGMPVEEEGWVLEERMKLKARRNGGGWRGRRGKRGGRRRRKGGGRTDGDGGDPRGASRSTDTPEEIAAKRAARKAKKERLEQSLAEIARALGEE